MSRLWVDLWLAFGLAKVWVCHRLRSGQSIQGLEAIQMARLVSPRWAHFDCPWNPLTDGIILCDLLRKADNAVDHHFILVLVLYVFEGALLFDAETGQYRLEWHDTKRLESTLSVKNRSMELSELVRYEGRLFAFCYLAKGKAVRCGAIVRLVAGAHVLQIDFKIGSMLCPWRRYHGSGIWNLSRRLPSYPETHTLRWQWKIY